MSWILFLFLFGGAISPERPFGTIASVQGAQATITPVGIQATITPVEGPSASVEAI